MAGWWWSAECTIWAPAGGSSSTAFLRGWHGIVKAAARRYVRRHGPSMVQGRDAEPAPLLRDRVRESGGRRGGALRLGLRRRARGGPDADGGVAGRPGRPLH